MVRPIFSTTFVMMLACVGAIASQPARADTEVNTCGQVYKGNGFLSADLDCMSYDLGAVITLDGPGDLDLRGYTVTAPTTSVGSAIRCFENCTIYGNGGGVVGGRWGISGAKTLKVFDVSVTGSALRGIVGRRTHVERATVTNTGREAVTGQIRLTMRDSLVTHCGGVPDPLGGGIGSTSGVIWASRVRVSGSTVTDNFWGGIESYGGPVRIEDSVVLGNGTNPDCGVVLTCNYDVAATRLKVRGTLDCGRSFDFNQTDQTEGHCDGDAPITATCDPTIHNWGICTLD